MAFFWSFYVFGSNTFDANNFVCLIKYPAKISLEKMATFDQNYCFWELCFQWEYVISRNYSRRKLHDVLNVEGTYFVNGDDGLYVG